MSAKKILITRTESGDAELADAITAAGFEVLCEPMLSIEFLKGELPEIVDGDALIFTSSHGVQAFAQLSDGRDHPLYVVGRGTAEKACALGFERIMQAAGTVEELAGLIAQTPEKDLISPVYVRAEDISRDLKGILAKKGLNIAEFTAYKAVPAEKLSLNLLKSLDNREINAVMLFSNRGGRVFAELMEQYDRTVRLKSTRVLCISPTVLESVSVLPFQQSHIAKTPDREGMLDLLDRISVK